MTQITHLTQSHRDQHRNSTDADGITTATPEALRSFFFILPPELRNIIYRSFLVLPDGKTIKPDGRSRVTRPSQRLSRKNLGLSPQFLRTCRQAYTEARPILYGENTQKDDLARRPASYLHLIRLVTIKVQYNSSLRAAISSSPGVTMMTVRRGIRHLSQHLAKLPGIENLDICMTFGFRTENAALLSVLREKEQRLARCMQMWLHLRDIKTVSVRGCYVPVPTALLLRQILQGSTQPRGAGLPNMCKRLEQFVDGRGVRGRRDAGAELEEALVAGERGDYEGFERCREAVCELLAGSYTGVEWMRLYADNVGPDM
ncbi:hypothetical protein B0T16DRAFT_458868 [Cercophora newfieldiana]|uniref:Uncharacterized protein n=1 Tax=Cercophora newfieldiana TaxID=92897 RepID=A0AA40CPX9_9PEZI|nr:hypothetical protein B0T16DRAFT_458868 [Cercophora newfieldiana]